MINGIADLIRKFRPNILAGMLFVAVLGAGVSWFGYLMESEGIISAAGVGAIIGIVNLCGKILENE